MFKILMFNFPCRIHLPFTFRSIIDSKVLHRSEKLAIESFNFVIFYVKIAVFQYWKSKLAILSGFGSYVF